MSEELWKAFKEASDRCLLFIIRPNPHRKCEHKFINFISFCLYIICATILLINVIKQYEGPIISVINSILFLMTFILLFIMYELIDKKENIIEVITWLAEPTWKKFPNFMQPEAGNSFNRIRHISTRLIWFQIRLYDILAGTASFGIGIAMQFIPSTRYQMPLPWHLPIDDYRRPGPFLIIFTLQIFVTMTMSQVIAFLASFFIAFYLHVKEYMETILRGFDQITDKLEQGNDSEVNVDESLKILVKMIESCLSVMSTFTKTMSNILMCLEIISIFSIFVNAFIMLIVQQKEHYFIGNSILTLNLMVLGIAYVNDMLKEKISEVSYGLYKLPWDVMTPKQRLFIQFSMKCIDVDVSLNCANMHEFNLERFARITKQTYSNTLVLKRVLVNKFHHSLS